MNSDWPSHWRHAIYCNPRQYWLSDARSPSGQFSSGPPANPKRLPWQLGLSPHCPGQRATREGFDAVLQALETEPAVQIHGAGLLRFEIDRLPHFIDMTEHLPEQNGADLLTGPSTQEVAVAMRLFRAPPVQFHLCAQELH